MRSIKRMKLLLLGIAVVVTASGCTGGTSALRETSTDATAATSAPSTDSTPSAAGTPTSPPAAGTATGSCGPTNGEPAAAGGIASLPEPAGLEGAEWDAANADYTGYDPCAALSWSVVAPIDSTPSSPYAVLLFHDGSYLGTATTEQYAFSPEIERTSEETIAVTYRYAQGDDANADPSGRTEAAFTWNETAQRVDMTGSTPPEN